MQNPSVASSLRGCVAPALISYRDSKTYPSEALALETWVTVAEALAGRVVCSPCAGAGASAGGFDPVQFSRAIQMCRRLTCRPGPEAIPRIVTSCAAAGVAVVLVPNFARAGCHVSSASKWLIERRRAMIALSIRYRRDDQLYFSLFREAGAILAAYRKTEDSTYKKSEDSSQKTEGGDSSDFCLLTSDFCRQTSDFCPDAFARDFLVPPDYAPRLAAIGGIADAAEMTQTILMLAKELGICPGLLVGRLQHDGIIDWKHQNKLKREVDLKEVLTGARAAEKTWPDQAAATRALMRDLNVKQDAARKRLERAAAEGDLLTNARGQPQRQRQRRFEPGQLDAWRLVQRDRGLDAEDRDGPDEQREARKMRRAARGREEAA